MTDVVWSPTIATVFAAVTRDGRAALWDLTATSAPVLDQTLTADKDAWREQQAAAAAAALAATATLPAAPMPAAPAAAASVAAQRTEAHRSLVGLDDDDGGAASAATEAAASALPPARRLTSVSFADTNGLILLVGDATGSVDVFRIVGCDELLDPTAGVAAASSGGGVEESLAELSDAVVRAPPPSAPATELQRVLAELGERAAACRRPGVALTVGGTLFAAQERALCAQAEILLGGSGGRPAGPS